jgi:hypothetical protein
MKDQELELVLGGMNYLHGDNGVEMNNSSTNFSVLCKCIYKSETGVENLVESKRFLASSSLRLLGPQDQ